MKDSKEQEEENSQEEDTQQMQNLKDKLNIAGQQIQIYQELEKMSNKEIFRYSLLSRIQENTEALKLIGRTLINIGKVLEDKNASDSEQEEEETPKPIPRKEIPTPVKKKFFGSIRKFGDDISKGMEDIP